MSMESKSREELEREANEVRRKLLRTVEQLDHRRHQVLDVRSQLAGHGTRLVVGAVLLLTVTTASAAFVVRGARTSGQRRRRARWTLLRHVWQQPERALRAERPSFVGELGRSLLLSALSAGLAIPIRRTASLLADHLAPSAAATPDVPFR